MKRYKGSYICLILWALSVISFGTCVFNVPEADESGNYPSWYLIWFSLSMLAVGVLFILFVIFTIIGIVNAAKDKKQAQESRIHSQLQHQSEPQENHVYCPTCGAENRYGDKYCRKCGKPLVEIPTDTPLYEETSEKTSSFLQLLFMNFGMCGAANWILIVLLSIVSAFLGLLIASGDNSTAMSRFIGALIGAAIGIFGFLFIFILILLIAHLIHKKNFISSTLRVYENRVVAESKLKNFSPIDNPSECVFYNTIQKVKEKKDTLYLMFRSENKTKVLIIHKEDEKIYEYIKSKVIK
jgi:predicted RNA-binding Zn-ribbon protein involved in translation (DUF1610 family)